MKEPMDKKEEKTTQGLNLPPAGWDPMKNIEMMGVFRGEWGKKIQIILSGRITSIVIALIVFIVMGGGLIVAGLGGNASLIAVPIFILVGIVIIWRNLRKSKK